MKILSGEHNYNKRDEVIYDDCNKTCDSFLYFKLLYKMKEILIVR